MKDLEFHFKNCNIMKYTIDQIAWAKNEMSNTTRTNVESSKIIAKELNTTFKAVLKAYYDSKGWLSDGSGHSSKGVQVKDVKICMTFIKNNPDNLQHAFRLASKSTGQSVSSIQSSYYLEGGNLNAIKNKKSLFNIVGFFNIFKKNMKNNIAKGKTSL